MPARKLVASFAKRSPAAAVELPQPRLASGRSIEDCLRQRRSCRFYAGTPVAIESAGQLLWAAQGVTGLGGLRTAPSAGALYPLHLYLVAMNIAGLSPGAYAYDPGRHLLSLWKSGDLRKKLVKAACDQPEPETAALGILITAAYGRTQREFGERGVRLVHMEAGHVGQNVLLEAASLGLGALGLSKIDVALMRRALDLPDAEEPIYLLLAGPK